VKFLKVPYHLLFPMIVLICCLGIFSVNLRGSDVLQVAGFGVLGYVLFKLRYEAAPILLGLVLGGLLEDNLFRGLILSRGSVWNFIREPLTLLLLVLAIGVVVSALMPAISRNRSVLAEDG